MGSSRPRRGGGRRLSRRAPHTEGLAGDRARARSRAGRQGARALPRRRPRCRTRLLRGRRARLEGRARLSAHRRVPPLCAMKAKPKVVVVMPAYNAGSTLRLTYEELPKESVNLVILVDDGSKDRTLEIARELGLEIFVHDKNYGYGAHQKTCYTEALKAGADSVVMVHPDYQYDPTLVPKMIEPIVKGAADPGLRS